MRFQYIGGKLGAVRQKIGTMECVIPSVTTDSGELHLAMPGDAIILPGEGEMYYLELDDLRLGGPTSFRAKLSRLALMGSVASIVVVEY